jgi:branched-subunit amino acid transport protein AzlD
MKFIVVIILLAIISSLASALYYLVKKEEEPAKLVRALTWRIGLSITLFFLLIIAFIMGWIQPHGI